MQLSSPLVVASRFRFYGRSVYYCCCWFCLYLDIYCVSGSRTTKIALGLLRSEKKVERRPLILGTSLHINRFCYTTVFLFAVCLLRECIYYPCVFFRFFPPTKSFVEPPQLKGREIGKDRIELHLYWFSMGESVDSNLGPKGWLLNDIFYIKLWTTEGIMFVDK